MKATELMIGDWVFDERYGTPHKISLEEDFHFCCSGELCFKPIPLTDEILEKNGWYRDSIFMELKADENTQFSWTGRCGAVLYRNGWHHCDCKYVHTLQHALRLCGFDKLADYFKI